MNASKPWYLSRTIWASVVTVATASASLIGIPLGGIDDAVLVDTILQAITAISGILAVMGRLSATTKIG
ncbi:hypothetical protein FQ775_12480 [Nitratireductor mangrovi]|uniref:Holin n=1 Tax=Nitratireductor mangrovi TaxID=2599600 RepID=A0A5B8KZD8_9HYPH|nr:hypothetical protein [Nitratireductor mangrovi]QDZ01127.1 hypothetical protein FQ775_12480 [Nitratireductor mangrovi]